MKKEKFKKKLNKQIGVGPKELLTTKIENHVENIANENGLIHVSSETIDVLSLSLQFYLKNIISNCIEMKPNSEMKSIENETNQVRFI
jgi:hypothetical protein